MDAHGAWREEGAAYALGALEPDEATRFEDHARHCAECRAELDEMRLTLSVLPLSAPQLEVSKALRKRVITQVNLEGRAAVSRRNAIAGPSFARWPRLAISMPAVGAAGVGLLAAAVIATVALTGGSGVSTHIYEGKSQFAHASVTLRTGTGAPELVVDHIPAPPKGDIYEVWVARHGVPQPTSALFDVGSGAAVTVAVPSSLRGADAVMVTAEPAGGTLHPTRAPVIEVPLS